MFKIYTLFISDDLYSWWFTETIPIGSNLQLSKIVPIYNVLKWEILLIYENQQEFVFYLEFLL